MDLNKREKSGLIVFIVIILLLLGVIYFNKSKEDSTLVIAKAKDTAITDNVNGTIKNTEDIQVYISGEIKKPGVYMLKDGDRVERLIELCGGFTSNADTTNLNQAMKLKDEDYIRIPSKLTVNTSAGGAITGTSGNSSTNTTGIIQGTSSLININSATKEQLMDLPRIGDAMSQRIIDYREKIGSFKDIKDITNVSGIGPKMFENIKDKITVH